MARYGDLDSQYFDDAGNPLVNGKIYFYETGTTTPKTTYADVNYEIPNTNPVILTAAGRQPNIFFPGVAKAILATSSGTQILTRDPVGETASTFGNPWIASKEYNANDVAQGSDGEFYLSLSNGNANHDPVTSSGYWTFLYSVEWTAGTTYNVGSVVTYQTIVYQSLQNSNFNKNPSTETAWWVPINLAWLATATYAINANVVGTDGVLYTSLQNANTNHTPASSPSWWVGSSAAAAASASAAATSATSASTSATNAATSATSASSSASSASTSATNAAASATTASTQASNASTSASSAATSATNALSYLNTFKGQYYGPLASDPTVDPLGAAMTAGDLYWNTTASQMKTYTGSAWIAAYIPVTGYALSGANSDITSLSGLTTPLSVAQGGTGLSSTGAVGNVLTSNGTTWYSTALPAATVPSGAIIYTALNFGGF
jgi:hypothetical protein